MRPYRRFVIKLGTSVLTGGTLRLDRTHMADLARQCADLHASGRDFVIVTSGAIAAGRERLGITHAGGTLTEKQMLAAVGQSRLMRVWEQLFDPYGIYVGQLLLTRADVHDRHRFLNARDTLSALLEHRIVPVVNENDAVATAEIKVGDNDNLSALVAILGEADVLLLLTDQPGLFTANPRTDPNATLIPEVRMIDATLHRLASGPPGTLGTGGMVTKLQAADTARRAGVDVIIAAGRAPEIISRIASGEAVGTRFPALNTPLESRKRWILGGPKPVGRIVIDAGAVHALCGRGSSLLPAGILAVEGPFQRGDTARIFDAGGHEVARGIARYDSDELDRIRGHRSDEITSRLGYAYGPVAVHRNDLILLLPDSPDYRPPPSQP